MGINSRPLFLNINSKQNRRYILFCPLIILLIKLLESLFISQMYTTVKTNKSGVLENPQVLQYLTNKTELP